MKLSAILVSVNLVAAMPVAANAAENAMSDKAAWLKKSMAAMETTKKAATRKISLSDAGVAPAKTIKLRAFVPNRRLPSERDMTALTPRMDSAPALMAQKPVMGTDYEKPLAGGVSAYTFDAPSAAATRRVASQIAPAQRAIPGRAPALPGQFAARTSMAPAIPVIPEPPSADYPSYMDLKPPAAKANRVAPAGLQPERMLKQAGALLVQAPVLTPDERTLVKELVNLNQPGRSGNFIDVQGGRPVEVPAEPQAEMEGAPEAPVQQHADLGPPPFPLNLLPQDKLQEFVGRRKQQKIATHPVYFGSWHKPVAQIQQRPALPYAGFQTHMQSQRILASNYAQYAPVAASHSSGGHKRARRQSEAHHTSVSHPYVATYPAYQTVNRVSSF